MTLDEARAGIGRGVVYLGNRHLNLPLEHGVITSVNQWWVFVRYGHNKQSAATSAEDLEFE